MRGAASNRRPYRDVGGGGEEASIERGITGPETESERGAAKKSGGGGGGDDEPLRHLVCAELESEPLCSRPTPSLAEAADEIKHSLVVTQDLADNLAGAARATVAHHLLHQLPAEPLPLDVRAHQDRIFRRLVVEAGEGPDGALCFPAGAILFGVVAMKAISRS